MEELGGVSATSVAAEKNKRPEFILWMQTLWKHARANCIHWILQKTEKQNNNMDQDLVIMRYRSKPIPYWFKRGRTISLSNTSNTSKYNIQSAKRLNIHIFQVRCITVWVSADFSIKFYQMVMSLGVQRYKCCLVHMYQNAVVTIVMYLLEWQTGRLWLPDLVVFHKILKPVYAVFWLEFLPEGSGYLAHSWTAFWTRSNAKKGMVHLRSPQNMNKFRNDRLLNAFGHNIACRRLLISPRRVAQKLILTLLNEVPAGRLRGALCCLGLAPPPPPFFLFHFSSLSHPMEDEELRCQRQECQVCVLTPG